MKKALLLLFPMCFGLFGCASTPKYSQSQLNAIETREVEASLDETFNAASSALFDAGYTISMSDRQAGLITGTQAVDRSAQRFWVSVYIEDTRYALSIQIREESPSLCAVRCKMSKNGQPYVDKEAIDQIWVLMQRQVLMKQPIEIGSESATQVSIDTDT